MTTTQTQPPELAPPAGSELQGIYTKRGNSLDIAHYKPVNPKAHGDKEKGWTLALVGKRVPSIARGPACPPLACPCVHKKQHGTRAACLCSCRGARASPVVAPRSQTMLSQIVC
jgi:hypothetical protein